MERTVVFKGIVKDIERINSSLSFATLAQVEEESSARTKVPIYGELERNYIGKLVAITNERKGFFGGEFEQRIQALGRSIARSMSYQSVMDINNSYRAEEQRQRKVL